MHSHERLLVNIMIIDSSSDFGPVLSGVGLRLYVLTDDDDVKNSTLEFFNNHCRCSTAGVADTSATFLTS